MEPAEMFPDISDSRNWIEVTPIESGLSGERKYHILRTNGSERLLRVSDISRYKRHCENASFAQFVHERLGFEMNLPIEVAAFRNDTLCYSLYTWVEGEDADNKITNLHTPEQVKFGERAGRLLRRIHTLPSPKDILPWDLYFSRRIDELLGLYHYRVRSSFEGDKQTAGFIERGRTLMENRPQTALHGDFRSGNLIVTADGELAVIDFGRWCWGDPYMDFRCIRRSCTPSFSRGQINGYFDGNIPGDFFPLMAFYTAVETISHICAAYNSPDREKMTAAIAFAEKTVTEYDGFETMIPRWY